MNIQQTIRQIVSNLYGKEIHSSLIQVQKTKKDFKGHLTLVVFPLLKISGKNPEQTAQEIGERLLAQKSYFNGFNVVKGFLNLTISPTYWIQLFNDIYSTERYGIKNINEDAPLVMVEYSSPNTNKPLHLGHIRNNLLGYSLAEILKANGNRVIKTNIVNDRGIHICKSMLAWKKWGRGETPSSSGKKGDHLIGDYYVKFDQEYKKELAKLESTGLSKKDAEEQSSLMVEVREMLRQWEEGNMAVVDLWKTMNAWVYKGFDTTYENLGVVFDKTYYE
jgi:arginyl-tRNA synthetase